MDFDKIQNFNNNIINTVAWNYNVKNKKFELIYSNGNFNNISNVNLKMFFNSIKPCFGNYLSEFLCLYIDNFSGKKTVPIMEDSYIQTILPVKLNKREETLVTLYIIPKVDYKSIVELSFFAIPLKKYRKEALSINILKNGRVKKGATTHLKRKITSQTEIFTKEQLVVFNLLLKGYSSANIARFLDKKQKNVLRFNIRINYKLSCFFDINFNTINDAISYYKECFID